MSKVKIDHGVTIDNRIRITSGFLSSHPFLYFLFKFIFMLIGTLAILYSWIIGMDLYIDERTFLVVTIISVMIFTLMQEYPKAKIYISLIYLVLLMVSCYYYWEYLQNGFYCLENAFIKYAALYYNVNPFRYVVSLDPYKSTTILLLLLTQMVGFIVSVEVYKHYMRSIYMFLIFVFYGTLLALGIIPNGAWMIILVIVYSCMRTMDRISSGKQQRLLHRGGIQETNADGKLRIRIHSVIVMSAIFLVAFLIARIMISPYFYDNKLNLADTKKDLQKAMKEFSLSETIEDAKKKWNEVNPFQPSKPNFSGGLDSGKLGDVGSISFTGEVALKVALNSNINYLYMKGFVGSVYLSDEWAQLSKNDIKEYESIQEEFGDSSLNAETLLYHWIHLAKTYGVRRKSDDMDNLIPNIPMNQSDISVKYENANKKFLYAPYICNFMDVGELEYIGASYFRPENDKQDNYVFTSNFVSYDTGININDFMSLMAFNQRNYELDVPDYYDSNFSEYERNYRSFVYDVYTRLPKEGLEQLKSVDLGVSELDYDYTYQTIMKVIQYLRENTSYSLSPGVPHTNQDFAEYFLFDAKKGYCSHYATAAVLLLRNYGVPARYIEGYIVTKEDIRKGDLGTKTDYSVATIRDYNAHAWIEVYFDGIGWIPVEVTNGYSEVGTMNLLTEIEESDEATPTVVVVEPTKSPVTTAPSITTMPEQKPSITPTRTPVIDVDEDNSIPIGLMIFIFSFGSIAVIITSLYVRYGVRKRTWLQLLTKGTPSQQVIANYLAIERILKMLKIIKAEAQTYEEFTSQASIQCDLLPEAFQDIVSLALKANFSKEEITIQDRNCMYEYYHKFRNNYYNSLSKKKQFLLKYWEVI